MIIQPAAPEEAAFCDKLFLGSPVRPKGQEGDRETREKAPIIYVHAKIIVGDAERAIVSSANLNGRSMRWDTEAGVALKGKDALHLFQSCTAHWFGADVPQVLEHAQVWRDLAAKNAEAAPGDRPHFLVPHDPKPGERSGRALPGIF